MCVMLFLLNFQDKSEGSAQRSWLARRRCLRALRGTIEFMVLVTPFFYFGYVLCCHMPYNIGRSLPNWILLYEIGLFLRNLYVFFRYVWKTPILAALPVFLNVYFIVSYPPGPYASINEKLYLELFKKERMEVVRLIGEGKLGRKNTNSGVIHLLPPYTHLAMNHGMIIYATKNNLTSVIFSGERNILSRDVGICYIPDSVPSRWLRMGRVFDCIKMDNNWYLIFSQFGYLRYIMKPDS